MSCDSSFISNLVALCLSGMTTVIQYRKSHLDIQLFDFGMPIDTVSVAGQLAILFSK